MRRFPHLTLAALAAVSVLASAAIVLAAVDAWHSPVGGSARTFARAVVERLAPAEAHRAAPFARFAALESLDEVPCAHAGDLCLLPRRGHTTLAGFSTFSDDEDGLAFALVEPGERGRQVVQMDGRSPDFDALLRHDRRPLLWFVRDGSEYVTRDPELVGRARAALATVTQLGHEMGEVGGEMGRIGAQQGRHGAELGRLGARLASLQVRLVNRDLDDRERARIESRLDETRDQMRRARTDLRHAEREERMGPLGDRMRELSRRHREALREARPKLRAITEEAVRSGRAERLDVGA